MQADQSYRLVIGGEQMQIRYEKPIRKRSRVERIESTAGGPVIIRAG